MKKFFIKTFGCQQNVADSERIVSYYESRGYEQVNEKDEADIIVINTCMIRDMAEERVYGYIRNLRKKKSADEQEIILTGCVVGAAARDTSGVMKKKLEKRIPDVQLLPIEEVGFEYSQKRKNKQHAWVVISNGCNNFCTFCIVPFSRGKEISRPFAEIMDEVNNLVEEGYTSITLLGQNVNSYGSDLVLNSENEESFELPDGKKVSPVMVQHLGRERIPTLFPFLLESVAKIKELESVSFVSSNPWDFSDELIDVMAKYENIDRLLHLPVQSGSSKIIKAMNRWYTREEYIALTEKIKKVIPEIKISTDIIVGFPGETEEDFEETVDLAKKIGFVKVFAACYSPRPNTVASKNLVDDLSWQEKKRRYHVLNDLINKRNMGVSKGSNWVRER
ncbi:MAG: MiaB/RimO family radical SAM methylthiotransferase [Candidatus Moranbacteria bacterium]|nr:MiaB/RimO family radical SAM methylthiotransferase [Candidatus Moranbacteria bacterium]